VGDSVGESSLRDEKVGLDEETVSVDALAGGFESPIRCSKFKAGCFEAKGGCTKYGARRLEYETR
jgi:hypothetical protein